VRSRHLAFLIAALSGASACKILDVGSPLRVSAEVLNDPALAPVLVQSAIGDFECAFGTYVATTATLADEFYSSAIPIQSWLDLRLPANARGQTAGCAQIRGTPTPATYVALQSARYQADDTYVRLQGLDSAAVPAKNVFMATVAAYAGYAYVLFAEGYCTSAFDLGPEKQPAEVLTIADQRFTTAQAFAQAANNSDLLNFARVGRARVRLDQGRLPEAAADASLVPVGYVRNATFSSDSPRRQNQVYVWNNFATWSTVDPRYRNLTVGGVPDPRVGAVDAGRNGVDQRTRLWLQTRYPSDGSPIPIATWEEAQLIIAEAQGGQSAVDVVNRLRARVGLPATFASADPIAIRDTVREERRRQLFLQGHRLNDMIRFNLTFDSGLNNKGQDHGDMTCFPLPRVETDNNPNIHH